MSDLISVVVQAAAGSMEKLVYDEGALRPTGQIRVVPVPYPYPYGFIVGTTGDDNDNLDCYIITSQDLAAGAVVDCVVVGLVEQHESAATHVEVDHKVLAVLVDDGRELPGDVAETLRSFILAIFDEYPEIRVRVGPLRPKAAALQYLLAHRDD